MLVAPYGRSRSARRDTKIAAGACEAAHRLIRLLLGRWVAGSSGAIEARGGNEGLPLDNTSMMRLCSGLNTGVQLHKDF